MPTLDEANVRHLLRRTEFVDRTPRVRELLASGSIDAAVDDVMAVPANPPAVRFTRSGQWQRQEELAHFWLDRMAHDSARPFQERMALFWHGHFATSFEKVNLGVAMREQLDLFRRSALGNVRELAIAMSTQVAMLRYLDNNQNRASSPNQNFARELMELFLLGVGNYTEADVEAATAAWTGHTDEWDDEVSPYRWRPEWHDGAAKSFLGRRINDGGDARDHGAETIRVMLGSGTVPAGAANAAARGRPTREVAAEFLSRKLWSQFADGEPPSDVVGHLRDVLVANDFAVRPWVRAMLVHDAFYRSSTRTGLVRSPIEMIVALLVASGLRSAAGTPLWLMEGMGQRPFFPPNVAGWKTNVYWVNASAMEARARAIQQTYWDVTRTYWGSGDTGELRLAGGTIARRTVVEQRDGRRVWADAAFLDRVLALADLRIGGTTPRRGPRLRPTTGRVEPRAAGAARPARSRDAGRVRPTMLDDDIPTAAALDRLRTVEPDVASGAAAALDRRRFLQLVGAGFGAGLVAGPGSSLLGLGDDVGGGTAWAAGPLGPDDGILVVLGMYGGNDGLNTVVPIADGRYYDQHAALAIPAASTLRLDGRSGLHPALTEVERRWNAGEVAIVEGVGYPDGDLSHFNSMAWWMSGRVGGIPESGWLGRWLDGHLGGRRDLFAAVEIGSSLPLHLVGQASRGTVVPAGRPGFGVLHRAVGSGDLCRGHAS